MMWINSFIKELYNATPKTDFDIYMNLPGIIHCSLINLHLSIFPNALMSFRASMLQILSSALLSISDWYISVIKLCALYALKALFSLHPFNAFHFNVSLIICMHTQILWNVWVQIESLNFYTMHIYACKSIVEVV